MGYSRKEVLNSTIEYFNGDELAANVWINKYALKDSDGNLYEKTPDDMHRRLAKELYRIESKYPNPLSEDEIFNLLKDFKYIIPQGGSMSGIGNDRQIVSLSNCFVIGSDNEDSYGSIMKVDEEQVQLMKRRGGVGHDLSHIRPKDSPVHNSALTSTGIVPFMERYSNSTREVGQDGRRGALMLSLDIRHPNVDDFIDAKLDNTKVTGANISVKISDEFMNAVKNEEPFILRYPINNDINLKPSLINDLKFNALHKDGSSYYKKIDSKKVFDKLVDNSWKSAEPGILFWDKIINESPADCYANQGFKTKSTNPCGELPLPPYDSCRLLAINLFSYVDNPFTKSAHFNIALFKDHVKKAQRLMDDIVDLEVEKIDMILNKISNDPESDKTKMVEKELWEKMRSMAENGRRTGLGITGEGDMLAALGYTYGTSEATKVVGDIHKQLAINAYKSSCIMGEERGGFSIWDSKLEINNPFLNRLRKHDDELNKLLDKPRRNIALLTIAPTGSVSLMTQTTSGIESAFLVSYKRNRKINPNDKNAKVTFTDENGDSWEEYNVFHHHFKTWLEINGYDIDEVRNYTKTELNKLIKKSPYNNATSDTVDWVEKVKMQGEIQKWVDHSISVTVNLPKETSKNVVYDVFMAAWRYGCKGVTIYRDGSRSGVLVGNNDKVNEILKETHAPKRPKKLKCDILRFQNNKEKWVGFVGLMEDKPYEIFTGLLDSFPVPNYVETGWVEKNKNDGKSRYDFIYFDKDGYEQKMIGLSRAFKEEYWNYGKLISGVLRHGMPIPNIVNLVDGLSLSDNIVSWKSGVKRMLKKYIINDSDSNDKCPMCGNKLTFNDGCLICKDTDEKEGCGWSKCG